MGKKQGKSRIPRNADGTFPPGISGNPEGRGPDTPEQKIEKKALKVLIQEYRESLGEVLPELTPILKDMAKNKDMQAIKEVHDVIGAKSGKLDPGDLEKVMFVVVKYADNDSLQVRTEEISTPTPESAG